MKLFLKNYFYLVFVLLVIGALFYKTVLFGLLPIPADTIIGLYHPYRDLYAVEYPNGIPFKNFLITDPVRQIIPWKLLVIDSLRQFELPLWNPYEMSGKPLLANFQSGTFYIFNIFLFIKNFAIGWSAFIISQQILAAVFFYAYAKNLKLSSFAAAFGSLAFVFSGFFIAWLQWGTVIHTLLWLPLILLTIDKLSTIYSDRQKKSDNTKKIVLWSVVLISALSSSLFAGHLQTHFYVIVLSLSYVFIRLVKIKNLKLFALFIILYTLFMVLTAVQWIPSLQFIELSTRQTDQIYTQSEGWFIPFNQLIQFVAPDFFGNPTTLNYWGIWNYGEMVGYVGIIPLFFALYAVFWRKSRATIKFFALVAIFGVLFATDNIIAELPYKFSVPFLSSAQPTRLLSTVVFALAVLSAFGVDRFIHYFKNKEKVYSLLACVGILVFIFAGLWMSVISKNPLVGQEIVGNYFIAQKNLLLPTALVCMLVLMVIIRISIRAEKMKHIVLFVLISISAFDLLRFGYKFLPFTPSEYLFPQTETISFLQNQKEPFRIASINPEVMPPNFLSYYKLHSIEGYDPLYLKWYAEYVNILETENTQSSVTFNRIISPKNFESPLMDTLNVQYILTKDEIKNEKLTKVHTEGITHIYKNSKAIPSVHLVEEIFTYQNENEKQKALNTVNFNSQALVYAPIESQLYATGSAKIIEYKNNSVKIKTNTEGNAFLVFQDAYYPTWDAYIDGTSVPIYRTNIAFRGVPVPAGEHTILFKNKLF